MRLYLLIIMTALFIVGCATVDTPATQEIPPTKEQ